MCWTSLITHFSLQKEIAKNEIDVAHVGILNRNLFNGVFYEKLPKRLTLKISLLIDEFQRFFPETNFLHQTQSLLDRLETDL